MVVGCIMLNWWRQLPVAVSSTRQTYPHVRSGSRTCSHPPTPGPCIPHLTLSPIHVFSPTQLGVLVPMFLRRFTLWGAVLVDVGATLLVALNGLR